MSIYNIFGQSNKGTKITIHEASKQGALEQVKTILNRESLVKKEFVIMSVVLILIKLIQHTELTMAMLSKETQERFKTVVTSFLILLVFSYRSFLVSWFRGDAKVLELDKDNKTALHLAASEGHTAVVEALLEAGAQVDVKDKFGFTPLHSVMIGTLLKKSLGLNIMSQESMTSLELGHIAAAESLLKAGARKDVKDEGGVTPLNWAEIMAHKGIGKALLADGVGQERQMVENMGLPHLKVMVAALLKKATVEISGKTKHIDDLCMALLYVVAENCHIAFVKVFLDKVDVKLDLDIKAEQTLLHLLAMNGHAALLEILLEASAEADKEDKNGRTLLDDTMDKELFFAVKKGDEEQVKALLEAGAQEDVKDEVGGTLLHLAAREGYTEVVIALLEASDQVDVKDKVGRTPLYYAVEYGHAEVVNALLEAGAEAEVADKVGRTPLGRARTALEVCPKPKEYPYAKKISLQYFCQAKYNHAKLLLRLLEKKDRDREMFLLKRELANALPSERHPYMMPDLLSFYPFKWYPQSKVLEESRRFTGLLVDMHGSCCLPPLHLAARGGHASVVKVLLNSGATLNIRHDGCTALHLAAREGNVAVVEILLAGGAKVDKKDNHGRTAFYLAVKCGHSAVVEVLLKAGANVFEIGNGDWPELDDQIVWKILSKKTAEINSFFSKLDDEIVRGMWSKKTEEISSFFSVVKTGDEEQVKAELEAGSNIDVKGIDGRTALHLAAREGNVAVVEVLLAGGAKVDKKDNDGRTALHLAVESGHEVVVGVLLKAYPKAKIDEKSYDRKTPLYLASEKGYVSLVEALLEAGANVNVGGMYGTALNVAAMEGHESVVRVLLAFNVNINIQTSYDASARDIASMRGHDHIVSMIDEHNEKSPPIQSATIFNGSSTEDQSPSGNANLNLG